MVRPIPIIKLPSRKDRIKIIKRRTKTHLEKITNKLISNPLIDPDVKEFLTMYVEERQKQSLDEELPYDAAIAGVFRACKEVPLSAHTVALLVWHVLMQETDFYASNERCRGLGDPKPVSANNPKWFYLVYKHTQQEIKIATKALRVYKLNKE